VSGAETIAKRLGGRPTPGGQWLAPCPLSTHGKGRGDRNPSLSIADGERGLVVNCFAGCDRLDILHHLRAHGHLPDREREREPDRPSLRRDPAHQPDAAAVKLWREAVARGGVLKSYLERRCITIAPPTLRQGIALQLGRIPIPTMVAAVQAPDGKVIAVQETRLTWQGAKAPVSVPRITTGALGHGAVRLGPAGETLGLAEGVETALSAMEMSGVVTWATLGSQRLGRICLPPGVRQLQIFADSDRVGLEAASAAAQAHSRRGLAVTIRRPPEGFGDWNDVAVDLARESAA